MAADSNRRPAVPRRKPSALSGNLRREIAAAAARLMAEDGINDYGAAKRKAAKNLGATESETLPGNDEIAEELRAYQAIYQAEEQPERLRMLREAAIEAMTLLADFKPCLTGAVLDGTAGRNADIELDLFADSSKDVEIMLLSHSIPYQIDEVRHQTPISPETRLRIELDGMPLRLSVFPERAERRQIRSAHGSTERFRARIDAVTALLKS
jgi:hypothetical protein